MYGIYANIGGILMVNVTIYGIHGSYGYIYIQCEAPKIAKLVNITPITMVYGTYNYSYWGL